MISSPWRRSWRADPAAVALADRHYKRQAHGSPQFVPPGRCLVLLATDRSKRRTDSLVHGVSPLITLPGRVIGTKPAAFCRWVFTLLGAAPGDTLDDLFPGSGAVSQAWAAFTAEASQQARADASAAGPGPCDASRLSATDATAEIARRWSA